MSKNKLKYESINLIENTDIYIRNKFKKKDLLINLYDDLVKKKCYESAEVLAKYILDIHPNLIEIEYKLCLLQAKRGFVNSSVDRLNRFQKHGINNKSKSSKLFQEIIKVQCDWVAKNVTSRFLIDIYNVSSFVRNNWNFKFPLPENFYISFIRALLLLDFNEELTISW